MKIQCDVCSVEQASVLCCADEAVLCHACDGRIHSANKLAGKHRRFSLLLPSHRPLPLCDICKEKNGFVFCQEDRAILCRDCDAPIHAANAHAGRHSRFLLTGIRLSSAPILTSDEKPAHKTAATMTKDDGGGGGGGNSISDYLMKMLPGWRVDDFLFDDPAAGENESGSEFWKMHGTQSVDNVPRFAPASVNATAETTSTQEMQWHLATSSDEGIRPQWSEEEVLTVPELSHFHCDHRNNKRPRNSLWF